MTRRRTAMRKYLFLLFLTSAAMAQNSTTVTASNLLKGGQPLSSGQICFTGTDLNDTPIPFRVGGGGQEVTYPYCATVTNGAIVGTFNVANPANTAPANISYRIELFDAYTRIQKWSGVQFTGATFNFDNYVPSSNLPLGSSVNVLSVGNLTVTGSCSGCGTGGGGGISSLNGLTASSQTFANDTNVTISSSGSTHALGWTGTLAASRLNGSVVESVTNDANVTGSISAQNLALGWAGTLAKNRTLATTVYTDQANTYSAGQKQTFTPSSTTAGVNHAGVTADPSTLAAGDVWFRSDLEHLFWRDNATTTHKLFDADDSLPTSQLSGTIGNGQLANSATTVNGTSCTLGSSCNVGQVNDSNGNATVKSTATASAVDYVNVTNAATGNPATVKIGAAGSDANINTEIDAKGTGKVNLGSTSATVDGSGNLTVASCTGCGGSLKVDGTTVNNPNLQSDAFVSYSVNSSNITATTKSGIVTSGLVAEYRLDDCSGTTVTDYSGNSYNGTFAGGSNAPAWSSSPCQGLSFTSTASTPQYVNLPANSALNTAKTIMVFANFPDPTTFGANSITYPTLIGYSKGTANNGIMVGLGDGGNPSGLGNDIKGWGSTKPIIWKPNGSANTLAYEYQYGPHALTYTLDASTDHIYWDAGIEPANYSQGGSAANTPEDCGTSGSYNCTTVGNWTIGGNNEMTTAMVWTQAIYYVLFYNRELSSAEVAQNYYAVLRILQTRGVNPAAINTSVTDQIVALGDSLTAGTGSGVTNAYTSTTNFTTNLLNPDGTSWSPTITNGAVAGIRAQQTKLPARWDAYFAPWTGRNVGILWVGTNDIAGGQTAQQTYNSICSIAKQLKTRGWGKIVLATMISRTGQATGKNSLNSLLRNGWANCGDALADLAADANLGADTANTNTTYFQADAIHLTQTGYNMVGQYIALAVDRAIASYNGGFVTSGSANTKTAAYTMKPGDFYIRGGATGGTFTLTLPLATGATGMEYVVKSVGTTNAITINTQTPPNGSQENIENGTTVATSVSLAAGATLRFRAVLVSDTNGGARWEVVD